MAAGRADPQGSFPGRILLAVGKQLRVSEEVLGEEDAGEVYVYKDDALAAGHPGAAAAGASEGRVIVIGSAGA